MALLSATLFRAAVPGPSWQDVTPADPASEPHHKLLLDNEHMRVFAVAIPSHQQFYVRQERSVLLVALQDGEIAMWRQGQSPIQHFLIKRGEIRFFRATGARGTRNDSNSEYRNVTVAFKNPQVTNYGYRADRGKWDFGPSVMEMPVDPHGHFVNSLDLEKAIANDVQLLSGENVTLSEAPTGALLIALSDVELGIGSARDDRIDLAEGDVRWLPGGSPTLTNLARSPARFVLVKIK